MQATTVVEGFRLSPQQRRLWKLQQDTATGPSAFASQVVLLLEGELRVEELHAALERICGRHESLRTVFRRMPGVVMPVQVVAEDVSLSWQVIDPREAKRSVAELIETERRRAFDYEHGPLVSATLFALAPDRHLFSITAPALCADRRTLSNLAAELIAGEKVNTEPLQYIQFSEWQNSLAEEDEADKGREYWTRQDLSNASPVLPGQRARRRAQLEAPRQIESVKLTFTPELVARIAALATKHDTTVATVLLAAWQTLVWRLTQQSVVIGNVTDGRSYELLHDAFGLFARALPVCCQLTEDLRFGEVISAIDRFQHEAEEWQDYFSFDDVGAEYFPFGYEYAEIAEAKTAGDLRVSVYQQTSDFEWFDLKLTSIVNAGDIEAKFDYNNAVFDLPYVKHLAEQFHTLLDAALAAPETSIADLEIVSATQRQQVVVEWNRTRRDYELDVSIHQLFERQVERTPDALAAVFQDEQVTFAGLNRHADSLAAYLKAEGVGPETAVGICIEPSLEMLIAVLGILKAGGAYVPLDPRNPAQRINQVLQDAGAAILLTRELVANVRTEGKDFQTDFAETIAATITPENLAYIIYTSGSTGRPKGVMIQHRSVANLAATLHDEVYAGLGPTLKVGLTAPLAFDASVKQLVQLVHGHTLHILPEELRLDAMAALDYIDRHQLDVLDCTPSQLKLLLAAGLNKDTRSTPQLMLVGGEAIDASTWSRLGEDQRTRFFNVYGPTECTVDATWAQISHAQDQPTIGKPVPNAQAYVLDKNLKPTGVHLTGELFISGAGLARGYLNSPERTAERFIPDDLSGRIGARLYRTGDLGHYAPDGTIIYTGRNDAQVKIRGHRIELGEIEAVLQQHGDVKQAVVVARAASLRQEPVKQAVTPETSALQTQEQVQAVAGEALRRQELVKQVVTPETSISQQDEHVKQAVVPPREAASVDVRLVAYVVPTDDKDIDINALRQKLSERLPDYMVPSFLVVLDELPLTRNGKVDTHALPPPETARRARDEHYVAPRNEIEATITRVWQDVLGLERIGVNDNFFDAGGHSLLMVQVHNKLTDLFDKKISIVEMFAKPTISALAEYFSETNGHKPTFERVMDRAARRRQAVSMRQ